MTYDFEIGLEGAYNFQVCRNVTLPILMRTHKKEIGIKVGLNK